MESVAPGDKARGLQRMKKIFGATSIYDHFDTVGFFRPSLQSGRFLHTSTTIRDY